MSKPTRAEKFTEFFGPGSKNFFGSGLTLEQFMAVYKAEEFERSWTMQSPDEKKRRLHLVVELSCELKNIYEQTNHATALAEMAIEAVITGDWAQVQDLAQLFHYNDEREVSPEAYESTRTIYTKFRELLAAAYETRPDKSREKV